MSLPCDDEQRSPAESGVGGGLSASEGTGAEAASDRWEVDLTDSSTVAARLAAALVQAKVKYMQAQGHKALPLSVARCYCRRHGKAASLFHCVDFQTSYDFTKISRLQVDGDNTQEIEDPSSPTGSLLRAVPVVLLAPGGGSIKLVFAYVYKLQRPLIHWVLTNSRKEQTTLISTLVLANSSPDGPGQQQCSMMIFPGGPEEVYAQWAVAEECKQQEQPVLAAEHGADHAPRCLQPGRVNVSDPSSRMKSLRAIWAEMSVKERIGSMSFGRSMRTLAVQCCAVVAQLNAATQQSAHLGIYAGFKDSVLVTALEFIPDPQGRADKPLGMMFSHSLAMRADIWEVLEGLLPDFASPAKHALPFARWGELLEPSPSSWAQLELVLARLLEQRFLHLLSGMRDRVKQADVAAAQVAQRKAASERSAIRAARKAAQARKPPSRRAATPASAACLPEAEHATAAPAGGRPGAREGSRQGVATGSEPADSQEEGDSGDEGDSDERDSSADPLVAATRDDAGREDDAGTLAAESLEGKGAEDVSAGQADGESCSTGAASAERVASCDESLSSGWCEVEPRRRRRIAAASSAAAELAPECCAPGGVIRWPGGGPEAAEVPSSPEASLPDADVMDRPRTPDAFTPGNPPDAAGGPLGLEQLARHWQASVWAVEASSKAGAWGPDMWQCRRNENAAWRLLHLRNRRQTCGEPARRAERSHAGLLATAEWPMDEISSTAGEPSSRSSTSFGPALNDTPDEARCVHCALEGARVGRVCTCYPNPWQLPSLECQVSSGSHHSSGLGPLSSDSGSKVIVDSIPCPPALDEEVDEAAAAWPRLLRRRAPPSTVQDHAQKAALRRSVNAAWRRWWASSHTGTDPPCGLLFPPTPTSTCWSTPRVRARSVDDGPFQDVCDCAMHPALTGQLPQVPGSVIPAVYYPVPVHLLPQVQQLISQSMPPPVPGASAHYASGTCPTLSGVDAMKAYGF